MQNEKVSDTAPKLTNLEKLNAISDADINLLNFEYNHQTSYAHAAANSGSWDRASQIGSHLWDNFKGPFVDNFVNQFTDTLVTDTLGSESLTWTSSG